MNHAKAIFDRLTTLRKVPEGIKWSDQYGNWIDRKTGYKLDDDNALAILEREAMVYIKQCGYDISPGESKMWAFMKNIGWTLFRESEHDTVAEALIAGLDHLIEQREADNEQ